MNFADVIQSFLIVKKAVSIILGLVILTVAITGGISAKAGTRSCMYTEGQVVYRCEDDEDEFCFLMVSQDEMQEQGQKPKIIVCTGPKILIGELK